MNEPTRCPIRDENGHAPLEHSCCRELAALEARALRMERALRAIEAWPFNIMAGDWMSVSVFVADARALARKALEEADDE